MFLMLLILFIVMGLSWILTCGLVYLIMLCFGLHFTWLIGTGIWLIMLLLKQIFKTNVKVDK